ncbi:MAG: tRNA (cytidine(34)-2'-O)-methyltransferase [Nitrospirae bacterium]|nr:tRNA (cytidine(34)-2'-O)-methyltransferase [Nitrospirota bacterium]
MPLNVVLLNPEIPWNTGNIGRTCVAVGATLHLVGKLGFRIESKEIRRAGLDYWPNLRWQHHKDFDAFLRALPTDASLLFFSAKAKPLFWNAPYERDSFLIFGSESKGLPSALHRQFRNRFYRIPIRPSARSLNLSTAAGIVLYEAMRSGVMPAVLATISAGRKPAIPRRVRHTTR